MKRKTNKSLGVVTHTHTHTHVYLKNRKAITLIALVITIIVLVILASVAINLSLGNNGIFNKAKYAKDEYTNSKYDEEVKLGKMTNDMDEHIENGRDTVTISKEEFKQMQDTIKQMQADIEALQTIPTYKPGTTTLSNSGSADVDNDSSSRITSLNLTPGNWIVFGYVEITCIKNRWCSISGVDFTTKAHGFSNETRKMNINCQGTVKTSTNKTIYLNGGQNSGSTVSVSGSLFAIKISEP